VGSIWIGNLDSPKYFLNFILDISLFVISQQTIFDVVYKVPSLEELPITLKNN